MTPKQRLEALEGLATALEALARVLRITIEPDDPPNVVRDPDKTGPRSAFNGAHALASLKRVFADARTATDRERVRKVARKLAAQGLITDGDVEALEQGS